jgi:UDP-glucose:(heptosyl)LPS alpha-1,3-glucosyltransferase
VAVSKGIADELVKYFPPMPIVIVPNGVDVARFGSATKPVGDRRYTFCFVGGDWQRKGLFFLVAALGRVQGEWSLVIAGSGPVDELKSLAASVGISERLVFLGHVADTAPVYWEARILLLASDYEADPLVVYEAMAAGVVPIVTPVHGATELIDSDAVGLVLPHLDTQAWTRVLQAAVDNELPLAAMASAAQDRVADRTWSHHAAQMQRVYERAM